MMVLFDGTDLSKKEKFKLKFWNQLFRDPKFFFSEKRLEFFKIKRVAEFFLTERVLDLFLNDGWDF